MPALILLIYLFCPRFPAPHHLVDLHAYNKNSATKVAVENDAIAVRWPISKTEQGRMFINLERDKPLFESIEVSINGAVKKIASGLDPAFILTVGKRDLVSQNGWNIFFDKVPQKPYRSYVVDLEKRKAAITTSGAHTVITISKVQAASFSGTLEITVYKGSALFNVAAVMATDRTQQQYFMMPVL